MVPEAPFSTLSALIFQDSEDTFSTYQELGRAESLNVSRGGAGGDTLELAGSLGFGRLKSRLVTRTNQVTLLVKSD